ncbi:MAG: preprotein translocase subunit SecG [Bacteroidales bacterium]|jgi:preprotein translocase subunit SecG|nr:preprotein translocase subunit SecG [Bacteroidales bacterium]
MYVFVTILAIIVAILLALVVLVQNSKGGGLAANFASQTQVMGVRKTADFLEKTTWGLAVALLVLSLAATSLVPKQATIDTTKTDLNPNAIKTTIPTQQPAQPTQPIQTLPIGQ